MSLVVVPELETLLLLQPGQHVEKMVVFGLNGKKQQSHILDGFGWFEVVSGWSQLHQTIGDVRCLWGRWKEEVTSRSQLESTFPNMEFKDSSWRK